MEDLLEWFHDDITWCGNECGDLTCERNLANRLSKTGPFSCSFFRDTDVCPICRKEHENIREERPKWMGFAADGGIEWANSSDGESHLENYEN